MPEQPWTVAFAGAGEATADNVKHLLDDWMHPDRKYNPPVIPDSIPKAQTGLKRVWDFLDTEFGARNVDKVPGGDIIHILIKARENGGEPYLVYIPLAGGSDPYEDIARQAFAEDIPVLDITAGLHPIRFTEPEAEKPQRGRPRTEPEDTPPWDEPEEVVTVHLSRKLVDTVIAVYANLVQAILDAVEEEKAAQYPFWMDEDGRYRPRTKGSRARKGEEEVLLTVGEIRRLGLEVPGE